MTNKTASCKWLRIFFWCAAIALGAADAWATRFTMNPDGISYLDIGDAYWRGDFHNAINAYWSPLYSWILGLFLKVLKPSAYWEYPVVHLVNFLIYVAALACFEFFLQTFIACSRQRDQQHRGGCAGLPESDRWVLGYSLFLSSSLILIGLGVVTPDMLVAGFVYLASALVLRIQSCLAVGGTFVFLGAVLGFSYLTKAVIFPLAFVFLAVAFLARGVSRQSLQSVAIAGLVFFAVAAPFIVAISQAKGRITFGESGKINYQIEVQRDNWFIATDNRLIHPVRRLLETQTSYEFSGPIPGTYPLWYDPSYWHEGARTYFDLRKQLAALHRGIARYWFICTSIFVQLNITLALLFTFALAPSFGFVGRITKSWPVCVPALTALLLYALVVVEFRYVAPFLLILWVSAFSGIEVRLTGKPRGAALSVPAVLALSVVVLALLWISVSRRPNAPVYSSVLASMQSFGLKAGDRLAVVGGAPEADGGAFVARLGRMQVIAQVGPSEFWAASPAVRSQLVTEFAQADAKAILTSNPPRKENGWERLAGTDYYLYQIGDAH